MKSIAIIAGLFTLSNALVPVVAHAQETDAAAPTLSVSDKAAVRCSAAFAILAGEQARGVESALAYPPLVDRGREYFVQTGARLTSAGWTREQVEVAMRAAVADLQAEAMAARDPSAVMGAVVPPCLSLLDSAVPAMPATALEVPTLVQCAALLQLSYEEVYAAEGLSARAKDLKTLANVLASRHEKALAESGGTGAEAERALGMARDAMLVEASAPGGLGKYDVEACFDLAKPGEKTHY